MAKKTYAGVKNDKEKTKRKIIDAVGVIIKRDGFKGLGVRAVAREANVHHSLINTYFGSLDSLVEIYIRGKDYWTIPETSSNNSLTTSANPDTRQILQDLLLNQLQYFSKEEEMQKIILWQISERSKIMFEVAEEREKLGAEFFKLADPFFEGTDVDLRAVAGLLVGGIYYMVLHAKSNDSLFCQIDLNSEAGIERIKKAISIILEDAYSRAKTQSEKSAD